MKVNRALTSLGLIFCLFFLIPYVYQFYFLTLNSEAITYSLKQQWPEIKWAFKNSIIQSASSAILALILAFIYTMAFFKIESKVKQRFLVLLLLLPSLVPSLFIIISLMPIFDFLGRGLMSVVVAHGFIFSGFASLQIINSINNKCSDFVGHCYIGGVSRSQFIYKIVIPLIKRDLIYTGLIVFISAFSSFSIPLVLGSIQTTGLEVLIFEKFKVEFNLQSAFIISTLQSIFLLILSVFTIRKFQDYKFKKSTGPIYFSSSIALKFFYLIHFLFLSMYLYQIVLGLRFLNLAIEVLNVALDSVFYTMSVAFTLASFSFLILQIYIFLFEKKILFTFFEVFILPSSTLIGLSSIVLYSGSLKFTVLIIALITLLLPWVIKIFIHPKLLNLSFQEQVSYIGGASKWQIYRYIRWPQLKNETIWSLSVLVFWAISDFTVTRIVLEKQETLSLVMYSLMSSYRLNQSVLISVVVLFLGLLNYLIINWGVNAIYKASKKKI